jgi:hypothetical protein
MYFVRFEVFAVVTMTNAVFWDITPSGSCKNRRFVETQRLGTLLDLTSNRRKRRRNTKLLVTANVVTSSQILVTLMMEALSSSETSVITRVTRCNISEDGIFDVYFSQLRGTRWSVLCS